jgi:CRP-like cAMP-binding protein
MENYDFYKNLKEEDKKYLFDNSKYIELPKNFTLFYQGDICNDILLLKEGTVQLMMYGSINELIPYFKDQIKL